MPLRNDDAHFAGRGRSSHFDNHIDMHEIPSRFTKVLSLP